MSTAKGVTLTLPHPLSALMADQCFGPTAVAWAPTEVRRQPVSRHLAPEFSLWRHLLVLLAAGWREKTGTKILQRGEGRGRGNKFSLHHASVPVQSLKVPHCDCQQAGPADLVSEDLVSPVLVWANAAELAGWGKGATPGEELALFIALLEPEGRRSWKLLKAIEMPTAFSVHSAAVRSWAPAMQWIKWEAIKMPLN